MPSRSYGFYRTLTSFKPQLNQEAFAPDLKTMSSSGEPQNLRLFIQGIERLGEAAK